MTALLPRPERPCGDALVVATRGLYRWALLVQRTTGEWAIPGGKPESSDADPLETARRELREETGLDLRDADWSDARKVWVPDGRFVGGGVDSVLHVVDLGRVVDLPHVRPGPDVFDARWFQAATVDQLTSAVGRVQGRLYGPHYNMLADALGRFDHGIDA